MEKIKLICFDLDLTLLSHSSWITLGTALGVTPEKDAELFNYYLAGKMTYQEWNNQILEIYQKNEDLSKARITELLSRYSYNEGAKETVAYLKEKGYIVTLISGSMDILVEMVAKDLGIEYYKANNTFVFDEHDRLHAIPGHGDDVQAKTKHLEDLCTMLNLQMEECACVGDGANDIKMFQATGHGVTFKDSAIENEAWKVIEKLSDLKEIF